MRISGIGFFERSITYTSAVVSRVPALSRDGGEPAAQDESSAAQRTLYGLFHGILFVSVEGTWTLVHSE